MTSFYLILLTITLYLVTTGLIAQRLKSASLVSSKKAILWIGGISVLFHSFILYTSIVTMTGFNLSLFNTLSASAFVIALLVLIAYAYRSLDLLLMLILPASASLVLLAWMFPSNHLLPLNSPSGLRIHVLISIIAYSLLVIATIHAVFFSIQNRHLHNHRTGGIVRLLPPLKEMEKLLFEIILVGFICLSLALGSGFLFLEDLFQQHLVHKTILSILAWCLYAALLGGHWMLGWRGRTAVRWTIGGFICLMLAYIGSKFVLEFIIR
jgi:ABC-type uncharacterized transport system permease subunit